MIYLKLLVIVIITLLCSLITGYMLHYIFTDEIYYYLYLQNEIRYII